MAARNDTPLVTSAIQRDAWSTVRFGRRARYFTTSSTTIAAAPTSGEKVAQLRTFPSVNIRALLAWLRDEEVDEDHHERAAERAVEVGLDPAGLEGPEGLADADGRRGDRVHGAVDEVLVDGGVEPAEEPADRAGEVHEAVDDAPVEPAERARDADGRLEDEPGVELVHVVLVVDDRPDPLEPRLERRRDGALRVLVEG